MAERDALEKLAVQVQALEDERAIVDRLYQWSDTFYRIDLNGWLDCFTEDATYVMRRAAGEPPRLDLSGHAELKPWFEDHALRVPAGTASQLLGQPRVTALRGDGAEATSFFTVIHKIDDAPMLFSTGRFKDSLSRCPDGKWRISEREGVGEMRREGSH